LLAVGRFRPVDDPNAGFLFETSVGQPIHFIGEDRYQARKKR